MYHIEFIKYNWRKILLCVGQYNFLLKNLRYPKLCKNNLKLKLFLSNLQLLIHRKYWYSHRICFINKTNKIIFVPRFL